MKNTTTYDVIIIGGSYAGLSAAMALGRSLRSVLIIDSGKPCNSQTPYSHNFLTHDGTPPAVIAEQARKQVLQYNSVELVTGYAINGYSENGRFTITSETGDVFHSRKLLFATGVKDILPNIIGLAECWGISALHCPYCHGYEVRNSRIGLLANGDLAFELARLLSNWTNNLVLFTNGHATLAQEQYQKIVSRNIEIVEDEISVIEHKNGHINKIIFNGGKTEKINTLFTRGTFSQNCTIPVELGCELTEQGYIKIDDFQRTTQNGVYAAGDNTTMFRAVSAAIAAGTKAGAILNKELIDEEF